MQVKMRLIPWSAMLVLMPTWSQLETMPKSAGLQILQSHGNLSRTRAIFIIGTRRRVNPAGMLLQGPSLRMPMARMLLVSRHRSQKLEGSGTDVDIVADAAVGAALVNKATVRGAGGAIRLLLRRLLLVMLLRVLFQWGHHMTGHMVSLRQRCHRLAIPRHLEDGRPITWALQGLMGTNRQHHTGEVTAILDGRLIEVLQMAEGRRHHLLTARQAESMRGHLDEGDSSFSQNS